MKIIKRFLKIIMILPILLSLHGCLDIFYKTEVHPNGQIDKTIVLEGDSTSIMENTIHAVSDSDWEAEWEAIEDDKHRLTLKQSFKNFKEFNIVMNPDDSLPKIRLKADLNKRFRWFFSYLEYKELLLPANPFNRLDWEEFLTADEMELISMDEEERKADPRFAVSHWEETESQFERYLYMSGYEEFYQYFKEAVLKTRDARITAKDLEYNKEVIYDSLFSDGSLDDSDDFLKHFYTVLDSSGVTAVVDENLDFIEYFDTKIDFFNECLEDNYFFSIKMPGLLIDTNSEQIEGSTLSWEADFFDFYFKGLEMKAESRVLNIWAFIVSGIIVFGLLIILILMLFRNKRS